MAKKAIIVILAAFLFMGLCLRAEASISINEVKYSPTTKQWIEIYNSSDQGVDITTYRILDSGASVNGHSISIYNNGTNLIPAHGYGVIAKSPEDFGVVSFPVFKSSLNIKVSNDTVMLKDNSGNILNQVVITGTSPNDNSLQFVSGSWTEAVPTPGVQNSNQGGGVGDGNVSNVVLITNTSPDQNIIQKVIDIPKIKTKIIAKNLAFVGVPVTFNAENVGYGGESLVYGKNFWNFGDGDSRIVLGKSEKFQHFYYYPGQYNVTLEYYSNQYAITPDAVNKVTIQVVPLEIIISKVGELNDFFVELSNNSEYEADISGWMLISGKKNFYLPQNTFIESKSKIILSPKITKFNQQDKEGLILLSQTGEVVYEYNLKEDLQNNNVEKATSTKNNNLYANTIKAQDQTQKDTPILEDKSSILPMENNITKPEKSYWFFVIFVILLLIAAGAVYFIRRRSNFSRGDEFEILDE